MSRLQKALDKILRAQADVDLDFDTLIAILKRLGFSERVRGSHHIFTHPRVDGILNVQPKGGNAKPYQVKQVRQALVESGLTVIPRDEV